MKGVAPLCDKYHAKDSIHVPQARILILIQHNHIGTSPRKFLIEVQTFRQTASIYYSKC
jgi:hypothetical protein